MPRLCLLLGLVLLSAVFAKAQRSPLEVSTGYSSLKASRSGWETSVNKNLWRGLGAEADFSDHFYGADIRGYSNGFSFLFGPRFSVTPGKQRSGRVTLFSHALAGGVWGRRSECNYLTVTVGGVTTPCTQLNYATAFETALGVGAVLQMSSHFGVRLAQVDYVQAYYPQGDQHNLRLSAGGVFFLGAASPLPPIHSPIGVEIEADGAGLTGENLGTDFHSIGRGGYGVRLNVGPLGILNFSAGYLYSNQLRSFRGSSGAELHSAGLQVFYGAADFNLLHLPRTQFYLSPGAGLARYKKRDETFFGPSSQGYPATYGLGPNIEPSANLGLGVKIFLLKRLGFRIEARDFVSRGGRGNFGSILCVLANTSPPCAEGGPPVYRNLPTQNNVIFTVGLLGKIF